MNTIAQTEKGPIEYRLVGLAASVASWPPRQSAGPHDSHTHVAQRTAAALLFAAWQDEVSITLVNER